MEAGASLCESRGNSASIEWARTVATGYDLVSASYRPEGLDPSDGLVRQYTRWLGGLTQDVAPGSRVLDLGCGCGVPAAQLLAGRYRVTGVDISPVQISRARRLLPKARFLCADMRCLVLAHNSFSAIIYLYALIHIPLADQPDLLRQFHEWLCPGGMLLATVGHTAWTGSEQDWLGVPGATMYWSHAGAATYRRWMADVGFRLIWERFVPEGHGGHVLMYLSRS